MNAAAGEEPVQVAAEPSTPGELLRRERERRKLSIQQAAEDLHLDAWMIEAIEANRFIALGAPVYAKGHLRKYAALLGLTPESIIERYQALTDVPVVPTPIPASVNTPAHVERISLKKPLLALLAVLAAAAAWWIAQQFMAPESSIATTPAQLLPAPEPDAIAPPGSSESGPALPERTAMVAEPPSSASPTPEALQASAPGASSSTAGAQVRLRLEFSDESWTEVYDGEGKRLMFGTGTAGRVRTLTGTPPLHVTLGAASAVSVQVNDEPILIPRRVGRDAAKFVIDAAGVVTPAHG